MNTRHIHPSFAHVLGMSDRERILFMQDEHWIGYRRATALIDLLQDLMERPRIARMPNLLIMGEPNNGKTTILRQFIKMHSAMVTDDDGMPILPVMMVQAPPTADDKGFYAAILERFNAPYRISDPATKLRFQVVHLCRQARLRVLVIDEFHNLLTGSMRKQREVLNVLKSLCNDLMLPIVGAGTRDASQVLQVDPQFTTRFEVFELPRWEWGTEFGQLLASFERVLPLRNPSNIVGSKDAMRLLHELSEGILGNLYGLLVRCAATAIQSGQEAISLELVKTVAQAQGGGGLRRAIV